jgi:gluconokinase
MAITLGTSASVRQMIQRPVLDASAGAFCYRASSDAFLLGCASSNGGNAIDWARAAFSGAVPVSNGSIPTFLPWLNGERSFEWNPDLRASWIGLGSEHTRADLMRAVIEGVVFNLVQYTEAVQRLSGVEAAEVVLSGNAFLDPMIAQLVASAVSARVLQPSEIGQATLRGAAVYAWRALGHDVRPALEKILQSAKRVEAAKDDDLMGRYERFKRVRAFTFQR